MEKQRKHFALSRAQVCLFFVGGKTMATGIDLSTANHLIILDPLPLEKGVLSLTRLFRSSQTKPLCVYHLVTVSGTESYKTQEEILSAKYLDALRELGADHQLKAVPSDSTLPNSLHNFGSQLVAIKRWTKSPLFTMWQQTHLANVPVQAQEDI